MTPLHIAAAHGDVNIAKVGQQKYKVSNWKYLDTDCQRSRGELRQQKSLHPTARGQWEQQGGDDRPAGWAGRGAGVTGQTQQDTATGYKYYQIILFSQSAKQRSQSSHIYWSLLWKHWGRSLAIASRSSRILYFKISPNIRFWWDFTSKVCKRLVYIGNRWLLMYWKHYFAVLDFPIKFLIRSWNYIKPWGLRAIIVVCAGLGYYIEWVIMGQAVGFLSDNEPFLAYCSSVVLMDSL